MSEGQDELEAIAPQRRRVVSFRGEEVEVKPITVAQLPPFTRELKPVLPAVSALVACADEEPIALAAVVAEWIEEHGERLVRAAAIAVRREAEWVGESEPDEFLALVTAIFAVNLDFFARRLLPALRSHMTAAVGIVQQIAGSGPTPSSSSPSTDTH